MNIATIKSTCGRFAAIAIAASAAIPMAAFAEGGLSYYFDGAKMHVRATSALAGKGLVLLWDDTDKGETAAAWAHSTNFVAAVPAAGGAYTLDLDALGISNGTSCRIASATVYERLDMLQMTTTQTYINTGILGKDVYGVRCGFYPTGKSGTDGSHLYSAVNCGKDNGTSAVANRGGFSICVTASAELHRFRFLWRGQSYDKGDNLVKTDAINEYAFTNRVCTLNGVVQQSNLAAGAISTNEHNVFLGKCSYTTYSLYGWWSHVSLDGEDGNKLIDYIPVQRASDGKVGFWNRVGDGSFVTSSGTGNFTAGSTTGERIEVGLTVVSSTIMPNRILDYSLDKSTLTVTVPSGIVGEQVIIAWDSEDKGDDIANWAHSAVLAESAVAGDITTRLGKLGVRNGNVCRVFAANAYKTLDKLQMTTKQCYINTGIKGTEVYGLRFGFMATGINSETGNHCGALGDGKDSGTGVIANRGAIFFGVNPSDITECCCYYRGDNLTPRHLTDWSDINEIAFTNRLYTVNDTVVKNNLAAGLAVSTNGINNIFIGRSAHSANAIAYGWWSHVSFDDVSGNRILDYIPVQRVSDGKVGFYDRATLSFVTSSGTSDFTAGTVTSDTPVMAVNAVTEAFTAADIPGLMIIYR